MPTPTGIKKLCPCCGHLMDAKQFYRTNNTEKYPDGYLDICKKCATLMVDNFDPDTFTPILQECDVPYIEKEWNASLLKYKNDPDKVTSMSVLGRYLAKMQLSHWRNYRWADTGKIEEEQKQAKEKYLRDNGYTEEEIEQSRIAEESYQKQSKELMGVIKERTDTFKEAEEAAIMNNMLNSGELNKRGPGRPKKEPIIAPSLRTLGMGRAIDAERARNKKFEAEAMGTRDILATPAVRIEDAEQYQRDEVRAVLDGLRDGVPAPQVDTYEDSPPDPRDILTNPYFEDDLTEDDRKYLSIKWGNYSPQEWVQLEKLYQDMCNSYDIQTAGHENDLKLVCKTSLKTNQLLDLGDIAGAAQAARMYDSLMKSGRFTAAQNKAERGEFVDSVAEIVAICEKEGFIPRYHTDEPQDRIDQLITDQKNYLTRLVKEDLNLGNMIDNALQAMRRQQESESVSLLEEEDDSVEEVIEEYDPDEGQEEITDEDILEFNEFMNGPTEEGEE